MKDTNAATTVIATMQKTLRMILMRSFGRDVRSDDEKKKEKTLHAVSSRPIQAASKRRPGWACSMSMKNSSVTWSHRCTQCAVNSKSRRRCFRYRGASLAKVSCLVGGWRWNPCAVLGLAQVASAWKKIVRAESSSMHLSQQCSIQRERYQDQNGTAQHYGRVR